MKNIIMAGALFFTCNVASFAQCDTKVILTSSTTEYLDSNNVVERTETENSTVKIDKAGSLTIIPGNDNDHEMKGVIKQNSCSWKVPFKEGKSIITATLTDKSGDVKNATLTIEGKEQKITLVFEVVEMPGKKIRVPIDSFQEDK